MKLSRFAALLGWLIAAAPLTGQDARVRLLGRVPAAVLPGLDSIVELADDEGIPTEPLIQKALEGGAKGAAPASILAAVGASASQLRGAMTLLRQAGEARPGATEVSAVAVALSRGVSPDRVAHLTAVLPGEPTGPALHAVADLVGHGFPEDSSVDLIVDAARHGLRGLRLLDVAAAAVLELQRGQNRGMALARVRDMLPNVPPPPRPAPATVSKAHRVTPPAPRP
jgi:hypothetical protein